MPKVPKERREIVARDYDTDKSQSLEKLAAREKTTTTTISRILKEFNVKPRTFKETGLKLSINLPYEQIMIMAEEESPYKIAKKYHVNHKTIRRCIERYRKSLPDFFSSEEINYGAIGQLFVSGYMRSFICNK